MTEVGSLKAIEVLLLLSAGAAVVWWQLRDLRKAREQSRAEREQRQAESAPAEDPRDREPRP